MHELGGSNPESTPTPFPGNSHTDRHPISRFRSYRIVLFKFRTLCVFEPPFEGLGKTYDVHLELIGKLVIADFLLVNFFH